MGSYNSKVTKIQLRKIRKFWRSAVHAALELAIPHQTLRNNSPQTKKRFIEN